MRILFILSVCILISTLGIIAPALAQDNTTSASQTDTTAAPPTSTTPSQAEAYVHSLKRGKNGSVPTGNPTSGAKPADGFVRAFDLYHGCKHYFDSKFVTRENVARRSACASYFFGVGSTLLALQSTQVRTGTCLPEKISTEDILRDFMAWAEINPDNLTGILSTSGVITALQNKYPCY